jgi:PTS system N-acetylglucosamine-specific IIC component
VYFGLYYGVFRFAIVRFDLKTPGRESESADTAVATPSASADRARAYITALGGAGNLESIGACTTRLRLIVRTQDAVDIETLKRLGARGVVRPSATALQVVVGPVADQLAGEIRDVLKLLPRESVQAQPDKPLVQRARSEAALAPSGGSDEAEASAETKSLERAVAQKLFAALGGRSNVRSVDLASSRLRVGVKSTAKVDNAAIRTLGLRGVAVAARDCVHVIVGPAAQSACATLRELLAS